MARTCGVLHLIWKCASHHNGVHSFDISTSKSGRTPSVCKCTSRHNRAHFFDIGTSKNVREWCVLYILTWKCTSHHNDVYFFNVSTSKSGRTPIVFNVLIWKCVSRHKNFFDISTSKGTPNPWCILYILTWKCTSRHNGVHFLNIPTSKSGSDLVCFAYFDSQMCFAPQRRVIFSHPSGQRAPHPPL